MPGAATAATVAASTSLGATAFGVAVNAGFSIAASLAFGVVGTVVQTLAVNFVLGAVSNALASKPKSIGGGFQSIATSAKERTLTFRQPITSHKVLFGDVRINGPMTFLESTNDNKNLHQVVTIAGHEIDRTVEYFVNDEVVAIDANGKIQNGKFYKSGQDTVIIKTGTGSTSGDSDLNSALTTNSTLWTSDHKQEGRTKVYSEFIFDRDIFVGQLPNISLRVRGKKLYDTRDNETRFSNNPALVVYDYLTNTDYGIGEPADRINVDSFNAAANICEEMITVVGDSKTFTADTSTDKITLANKCRNLYTGCGIEVSTDGTIPGGVSPATTYYYIRHSDTIGQLATNYANAMAEIAIELTDTGTGTHTFTILSEPRYTCNGVIDTDATPKENMQKLLTALHGLLAYQGGEWNLYAGAYRTPTLTLTDADLDEGPITVTSKVSRRELFNGVKGIFINPDDAFQPTDYPPVTNATYLTEDQNERLWKDTELPFTTSPSMAQRIAKIDLEKARQQITVRLSCNLTAMRLQAGDTVALTLSRMGWTDKVFDVVDWNFSTKGGNDAPRFGIDLFLRETSSTVYDWNSGEETTLDPAPNTNLPDPFIVTAPTNLTLTSGTDALFLKNDGTVISRIKASWTDSTDGFARDYELQFKQSSDSDWQPSSIIPQGLQQAFIWEVQDGQSYDVRIRSRNTLGVVSAWVSPAAGAHTVVGKTEVPGNVSGFSAQQNGNVITFNWDQVPDFDLSGYEIRYMKAPLIWDSAIVLTSVTKGTRITSAALPPGTWTLGIKAVDSSGNYSTTETTFNIIVTNTNDIVFAIEQSPRWVGTLTNFVRHDVSGSLIPKSQDLAGGNNFDVFDNFVLNPFSQSFYEAPEIDVGFDSEGLRLWAEFSATLGPNASGSADPLLEVDYKKDTENYDGYEDWTIGEADARQIKMKAKTLAATGIAYLSGFKPVVDVVERKESDINVSIPSGGKTIIFNTQFNKIPKIVVSAQGTSAFIPVYSNVTTTSFKIQVFDYTNADVGGTVNWEAEGA